MKIEQTYDEKRIIGRMNQWRGLLALVVLLSHIWGYTGFAFLVPFNKMVTIAVFIFFFLSGCGMTRSLDSKPRYILSVWCEKVPRLLYLSLVAYLFSAIMQALLRIQPDQEIRFLPLSFTGWSVTTNWYVFELIGFYILFSVASFLPGRRAGVILVAVSSVVAFIVLYHSGCVEAYYNSIFGFVMGMEVGSVRFSDYLRRWKKGYLLGCALMVLSFGMMFMADKGSIFFAAVRNIAAVGTVILLLYISIYVDLNHAINKVLCRLSPEIYFFHMPIVLLLRRVVVSPYLYMGAAILLSVGISAAFYPLDTLVHRIWAGLARGSGRKQSLEGEEQK